MATHKFDLPEDRPASLDETGHRVYLHPADVTGKWRNRRTVFYGILLVVFMVLPWIQVGGQQALLLDVAQRRFAIFGLTFWAHDAPILLFVIGGFAITLVFFTAVFGRVWCGWACPQTVFIDMVFRRIEGWVEGSPVKRRKLDASPWGTSKVFKKSVKWVLFFGASLVISHSFLAYFVGTERLSEMIRQSPFEHPASFLVMAFTTGLLLFNFGWFREQFCNVACPYGRLQSVLMDDRSLAPLYDETRGEPRKGSQPDGESFADCVNCYRCVQVCPTGIDIRRGLQMECIACTACIDACDEIMVKVDKPKGLIRYDSIAGMETGKHRMGARVYAYAGILVVILAGLIYTVSTRELLQMTVNRPPSAPYTVSEDGMVTNHIRIHLANQSFDDAVLKVTVPGDERLTLIIPRNQVELAGGQSKTIDAFLRFPSEVLKDGRKNVRLLATDVSDGEKLPEKTFDLVALGP